PRPRTTLRHPLVTARHPRDLVRAAGGGFRGGLASDTHSSLRGTSAIWSVWSSVAGGVGGRRGLSWWRRGRGRPAGSHRVVAVWRSSRLSCWFVTADSPQWSLARRSAASVARAETRVPGPARGSTATPSATRDSRGRSGPV